MSTYKPADSKREEFRKYLEKAGVIDTLTKVLVGLYDVPEKPDNALEFLMKNMGQGPETAEVETLRLEVGELRIKLDASQQECSELKAKLFQYEKSDDQTPDIN